MLYCRSHTRQSGIAIGKVLLVTVVLLLAAGLYLALDKDLARDIKKQAQVTAMETIGDVAVSRLAVGGDDSATTHGSAVDLIKRPIEVRSISDNVHYATGVGNTVMISTSEGVVIFDTGLGLQSAKQMRLLKEQVSDAPVRAIILSHSHADHIGGANLWREEGTDIIAHREFAEEQRYLTELEPYFYGRNRTLFPWMPQQRPDIALLRYGGITPTITVDDRKSYSFTLGGVEFDVIAAPGAEGADNIVLWLPQQKMLISGDFFGPQFPQFPNVFTMRGEKVRKPIEYVASLNTLLPLGAEIIVPSHLDPTLGADVIEAGMVRIRDAVQYVHDAVVTGMNNGADVYQLMREITLPPQLDLVQNHGKVDWAVRSIWDYYATWFHFDSTTALYPVPVTDVYADLERAAGSDTLLALAQTYLDQAQPVKALHVLEIILAGQVDLNAALLLRQQALTALLSSAEAGAHNDYEIYWLRARLADTATRLEAKSAP